MSKIFLILLVLQMGCSGHKIAKHSELPHFIPFAPNYQQQRNLYEARGKSYAIAGQGVHSARGVERIFESGGNIADAATAYTFLISVERPQSTGIGGGGFLLFYEKKSQKVYALDFREMAPHSADAKMFLDRNSLVIPGKSLTGIFSSGVPGLVAGILEFHAKFGKLPLSKVMAPAIELASNGFFVYPELEHALKTEEQNLRKFSENLKVFFKQGELLKEGDKVVQSDLSKTLRIISQKGRRGFYSGTVAKKIIQQAHELGGDLSLTDLKGYQVKWRQPVSGSYKKFKIFSMSPPSSGGVHIIQILNMLEHENLRKWGPYHPHSIHMVASAMQAAFADRAKYLGDPDFVAVPVAKLISKDYAQRRRDEIPYQRALKFDEVKPGVVTLPGYESSQTTHFSLTDKEGNIVVSTQTINGFFGSAVMVKGTGIILNNEMDDFATKVGESNMFGAIGGENNLVAPRKRPLSSMSPTIIINKEGVPVLGLGSPSGTRILTCVAQTILNYLEYGMPLYNAISSLRYHHQWSPDYIRVEEVGLPDFSQQELRRMGYNIVKKDLGCRVSAVSREGDEVLAVSDPRGQGLSISR